MAWFDAYRNGINVLTVTSDELDLIRQTSEQTFATLRNSKAHVSGTFSPFAVTIVPSWSKGFPFHALDDEGNTEIEVSGDAIEGSMQGSVRVTDLVVGVGEDQVTITASDATRIEPYEDEQPEPALDRASMTKFLREKPATASMMRLHFREHDQEAVTALLDGMRADRAARFDGTYYLLPGDQRVPSIRLAHGMATDVARVLREGEAKPRTVFEIQEALKIGLEEADLTLEALVRDGKVFLHGGLFSLPDNGDKRRLSTLILDVLHSKREPMTIADLMQSPDVVTYHPAWVTRVLETLVAQKRALLDADGRYAFHHTERSTRANGVTRIRLAAKTAHEAGRALTVSDLYELPDIMPWMVRDALRRLTTEKRIRVDGETVVYLQNETPDPETGRRVSFQEQIRQVLANAGAQGIRRDVVIQHFTEQGYDRPKITIALSEMCSRGKARYRGGIYTVMSQQPVTIEAPMASV